MGTRKGITLEALSPLDAPTQPRKCVGPSAAAPKDVSTVPTRKRRRAEALDEEEEERDADEPLAPNTTKRRKNVLAPRRRRQRKLRASAGVRGEC